VVEESFENRGVEFVCVWRASGVLLGRVDDIAALERHVHIGLGIHVCPTVSADGRIGPPITSPLPPQPV
jgi:hypothetical protein